MIGFLEHQGVKTGMLTPCQESLITRARNLIANEFLRQKSYTHLLFIDADIGFQPELPWKYLQADKDVVCGIYPVKYLDIEKLRSIDPAAMAWAVSPEMRLMFSMARLISSLAADCCSEAVAMERT